MLGDIQNDFRAKSLILLDYWAIRYFVMPAKAGIHFEFKNSQKGKSKSHWIPAFAGMTIVEICHPERGEGSSCSLYILAGFFVSLRMTCSGRPMDIGLQGSGFNMCLNCLSPPSPFFKGRGCRRRVRGTVGSSKKLALATFCQPLTLALSPCKWERGSARMVLTFIPLPRTLVLFGGLSPQIR